MCSPRKTQPRRKILVLWDRKCKCPGVAQEQRTAKSLRNSSRKQQEILVVPGLIPKRYLRIAASLSVAAKPRMEYSRR